MGSRARHAVLAACGCAAALALAGGAAASSDVPEVPIPRPPLTWAPGGHNYTVAHRRPTDIRYVVVHATEGPLDGTVSWLEDPKSEASSNYVVGRDGSIVQLIPLPDVAWHTGNKLYNEESVGIEHVGITDDPGGFTLAEYRASAKLAAWLCRRSLLPVDRKHIIGHSEVPDPFVAGAFGGSDHHTDPGRYWNWTLYMRLVRRYAFPAPPIKIASATLYAGQKVTGKVPWRASVDGPVQSVEFSIDGRRRWVARRAPFDFGVRGVLDTLPLANGPHALKLIAHGPRGALASRSLTVVVRNRPFRLTTAGVRRGVKVKGMLRFRAAAVGTPVDWIMVTVDGSRTTRDARRPYAFAIDTRRLPNGVHTLDLRSRAFDGRTAWRRLRIVVANVVPKPKPKPRPKPVVVGQSLADGQTLQGVAAWSVFVKKPVLHVDFLVDGVLIGSTAAIPYSFAWDTSAVAPGPHTLVARVVGKGGTVETTPVAVTVAAPAAPAQPAEPAALSAQTTTTAGP
jgi:N-acetyl-anhydromuramyl-L-alanine amidase AmpD